MRKSKIVAAVVALVLMVTALLPVNTRLEAVELSPEQLQEIMVKQALDAQAVAAAAMAAAQPAVDPTAAAAAAAQPVVDPVAAAAAMQAQMAALQAVQAQAAVPQTAADPAVLAAQSAMVPTVPVAAPNGATTYVDVCITNQTMTYYQNGVPVLFSPCVTGNPNTGHGTPAGVYSIKAMVPGKRLIGPTWNVWVNYWMRFTDSSIGLHDATWRKSFGGNIYQHNGSHGCVNLPLDVAARLYSMVTIGTPVIVRY